MKGIFSCSAEGELPWLYYAERTYIRRVRSDFRHMEIIVEETNNSIALDIDSTNGLMFWADSGTRKIMRAKVGGDNGIASDIQTVISTDKEGTFSQGGLAVDWLYKNVYWTDPNYDTIKVSNYLGAESKTLISTGLDEPRAICVDPENGYMYWTDVGRISKIERCGMDSQHRETIVDESDDVQHPDGLTIDYLGKRIYWIDSKLNNIGTAKLDGSDKFHLASFGVKHLFSITVFEDLLYSADFNSNGIISINKFTGDRVEASYLVPEHLKDITVYHRLIQHGDKSDQAMTLCKEAQCEYMCLPAANTTMYSTVACACPDNKLLSNDGRTCIKPESSMPEQSNINTTVTVKTPTKVTKSTKSKHTQSMIERKLEQHFVVTQNPVEILNSSESKIGQHISTTKLLEGTTEKPYRAIQNDKSDQAMTLCKEAQCEYMCLPAANTTMYSTVACACPDNKLLSNDGRTCIKPESSMPEQSNINTTVTVKTPTKVTKSTKSKHTQSMIERKLEQHFVVTQNPVEILNSSESKIGQHISTTKLLEGTTEKPYKAIQNDNDTSKGDHWSMDTGVIVAVVAVLAALIIIFVIGYIVYMVINRRKRRTVNLRGTSLYMRDVCTPSAPPAEEEVVRLFTSEVV